MLATQIPILNPAEFSRCEESSQSTDRGKSLSPSQKTDATIKESIEHAIWNDDILRAIEYYEIDVHVKNRIVYLHGHIVSTTSKSRIENAIRSIPGLLGIQSNLVLDDKLTLDVAASLGTLEHTYNCKFFTGASHGVISLNGNVSDENVKLLAERCAASNPNVRGVINNVRVPGAQLEPQDQPFLQPRIGEIIYFLDGVSGIVKQVIINPNNRCVIAMSLEGDFTDQHQQTKVPNDGSPHLLKKQLVVVPMNEVRYLTRASGFLYINSEQRNRYMEFHPLRFFTPKMGWKAPHPYCPEDVLFPIEQLDVEYQILEQLPRPPLVIALQEEVLWEQLLANDSLGG